MMWNRNRKKEMWEQDKNKLEIAVINAKVWFRKFQRETKGMGILFLILIAAVVLMNMVGPFISMWANDNFKSEQEKKIEAQAICLKYGCITPV